VSRGRRAEAAANQDLCIGHNGIDRTASGIPPFGGPVERSHHQQAGHPRVEIGTDLAIGDRVGEQALPDPPVGGFLFLWPLRLAVTDIWADRRGSDFFLGIIQ